MDYNMYIEYLIYPALAAFSSSAALHVFSYFSKRKSISRSIIGEINLILEEIEDTLGFLSRSDHYWLCEGEILSSYPKDINAQKLIIRSIVSDIYMLGSKNSFKITSFYNYYFKCEGMKRALFKTIESYYSRGEPMSERDVKAIDISRQRLCQAYEEILRKTGGYIKRISDLPISYNFPSTSQAAVKINRVVSGF